MSYKRSANGNSFWRQNVSANAMTTMKRILTILLFTLTVQTVFAYPITPQTLRKLIESSQFIVIATVDNPETKGEPVKYFDKAKNDTVLVYKTTLGGDGLADLYIKEILKGKPSDLHIQVTYEAGMICPTPARYPDKKTVIAFLYKDDTSLTYRTVGLSYGSKIMESEEELSSYRSRIFEYFEIIKMTSRRKKNQATVEWLVKCSENKFTRWEGAYELSRHGDFMSYYDRSKDPQFYKKLSKSQLQRLDSAFFATDTIGYNELCLAKLISKESKLRLKKHLIKNLEFATYYIAQDIMKIIIDITSSKELQLIYEEADNIKYDDKEKEAKQKLIIDKFITIATRQ